MNFSPKNAKFEHSKCWCIQEPSKEGKSLSQANLFMNIETNTVFPVTGERRKRSQSVFANSTISTSSTGMPLDSDTLKKLEIFFDTKESSNDENKVFLRKSTQPKFAITGDLNPHQIYLVKRAWVKTLNNYNEDELEICSQLFIKIFQLDQKQMNYFELGKVPLEDLRHNQIFLDHVKLFQPNLSNVMKYLSRATLMSKYLQQMGGKIMRYTKVSYKGSFWKLFEQGIIDVIGGYHAGDETIQALSILASFFTEQMRIGYKIEFKLQEAALKIVLQQEKKKSKFKK
ncbi:Globin-like domain and Globin, structural domain-containing protein [Strongyloides ratti]|uniref:Globin-like domain and Globin, structural domain-containing protein n=1 Tax=Strongyloides ratti TaxID=34506 RepID=A0A090KXB7_STRRB|nr:Globin-like domain and Globin, structural domain-containing protein [Strongyloides ratti]CEF62061.1 Globin-like domain and Globin, structural domain-containing protein [Strongyloides ratti]